MTTPEEAAKLAARVVAAFEQQFPSAPNRPVALVHTVGRLTVTAYEHLLRIDQDARNNAELGDRLERVAKAQSESNERTFGRSPEQQEIDRLQVEHLRHDLEQHGVKFPKDASIAQLTALVDAQRVTAADTAAYPRHDCTAHGSEACDGTCDDADPTGLVVHHRCRRTGVEWMGRTQTGPS